MDGEAKEDVRSRLDIEAVIGEYVQLKRAGRNWKGLSPFTDEKTPSFFVSPEKGIWHDFSSNQGGDVFSFVMQVEGLDFRAALEHLARKAGVDLSKYQNDIGSKSLSDKKNKLLKMHDSAATFYQRQLLANETARAYVIKRGFNAQVVHDFRIGYAPATGDVLKKFLLSKGYSEQEMRDGGLLSSRMQDMFRDRLMIPLADSQGQVIGFTARLLSDKPNAPKYLNTPQTILYDKGRHVYALHLAKEAIRKKNTAVLVEGNLDVISSHQSGVKNVVATAGTAMTEAHVKVLSRLALQLRLAFDGDSAGIAATERAIPIVGRLGVDLGVVSMPDGIKDPDELIRNGSDDWSLLIDRSKPAMEWLITQYESRYDITAASGKRRLTNEVLSLLEVIEDPVEQDHYMQLLAKKTGASLEALERRLKQIGDGMSPHRLRAIKHGNLPRRDNVQQDHLLALLCFENEIRDAAMELSIDAFDGEDRQELFRYLVAHPDGINLEKVPKELYLYETYVKIVQLRAETRYKDLTARERADEASHLVSQIKLQHIKQKKLALINQLREAEATNDDMLALQIRSDINNLIKEEKARGKRRTG